MFLENIETIKQIYSECKGSGMYLALFFISMLYIIIKEKNKNIKIVFGILPIITLVIILNPIFNKIVDSFVNRNIYWRMFWLLPINTSIAYASVSLIKSMENKKEQISVFIAICFIIMFSGKLVYNKDNFQKINNVYKLPDEAKAITYLIAQDKEEQNKIVMLPETLVPYIRQIDSSIELAYGRQPIGYTHHDVLIQLNDGNVEYVTNICKQRNWNYIIFKRETVLSISPEYFDYKMFAQTENYDIYKLDK